MDLFIISWGPCLHINQSCVCVCHRKDSNTVCANNHDNQLLIVGWGTCVEAGSREVAEAAAAAAAAAATAACSVVANVVAPIPAAGKPGAKCGGICGMFLGSRSLAVT